MKKLIALLLVLCTLMSMAACAADTQQPQTTDPTFDPELVGLVEEPLTWERINAIPIADSSMTEEQLRQICVDFMRLQITFPWTPSANLMYMSNDDPVTLRKGYAYGGMPYKGSTVSNLYNVMRFYDTETGIIDLGEDGQEVAIHIGNQCSGSAYWAWSRVSNSIKWGGTQTMTVADGCIPVGSYTYSHMITSWHNYDNPSLGIKTADICQENGEQVMYESYALLKMADGINLYRGTSGHIRMVSADAVVVRNEDGTIDPVRSYITYLDQGSSWTTGTQSGGTKIKTQGGVDKKFTFADMYTQGYLPWCLPEFAGLDPVEKSEVSITISGNATISSLSGAKITSNYPISDATVTVKDSDGNVVTTATVSTLELKIYEYSISKAVAAANLQNYTDGKHTVEISTRISTGEKPVIYTGTLTAG